MDPHRLPRTVIPSRYDIRLEPDFASLTFRGSETVTLSVREATTEIVLNAVELEIDEATLDGEGRAITGTPTIDEASERCRIALATAAAPGEWRLSLSFRGILNDKLRGFYRSV